MKYFVVGFRMPAQYRRHQVIAEDEEQAKELLMDQYKRFAVKGIAEILDTAAKTLSPYWIEEKEKS